MSRDRDWKKIGPKEAEAVLSEARKYGFPSSFLESRKDEIGAQGPVVV
jgi:hypothetical protein